MFWVVQSNLFNEQGFKSLEEQLIRQNIPHQITKMRHFDHVFDPPVEVPEGETKVWCCGSGSMRKVSDKMGWTPGYIAAPNYDEYVKILGDLVLNHDAHITTLRRAAEIANQNMDASHFFVRPLEDTKSFAGEVMSRQDLQDWIDRIELLCETPNTFSTLKPQSKIIMATPKTIYAEYRFFVVRGKVITGSLYKQGTRVFYKECHDREIEYFAAHCAEKLAFGNNITLSMQKPVVGPHTFALDVAETPDGLKVIELNSLNSSGFYACDMGKYVNAVSTML